jgi:nucleotidyltransferase/DNA polymerase involved in DNA repair
MKRTGSTWEEVVLEIKEKILNDTKLTCSIGVAPNKRLAKIAAEVNKPNGYYQVSPERYTCLIISLIIWISS